MDLRSLTAISALLAVLSFVSVSAGRAETYTVPIGREEILFDPGEGYCPLDAAEAAFDRRVLKVQRDGVEGYALILAVFFPCEDLASARISQSAEPRRWTTLLATLNDDGELRKAYGYTRFSYMDAVEEFVGKGVEIDEEAINKRLEEITGNGTTAPRIGNQEQLGVLGQDVAAVYTGSVLDVVGPNSGGRAIAVTALTLIADYPISYNVYRRFNGPDMVQSALAEAQTVLRQVVLANEALAARTRERSDFPVATAGDSPDPPGRAISSALLLVGGILFAAMVFGVYHRFGRKTRRVP